MAHEEYNIPSGIDESDLVHKSGTETITGSKTFSSNIVGSITGNAGTATKATQDSDGNKINSTYLKKADILNLVHPVGSLYWSKNSTDPSTLFGGTWKRIKDKFILACGDSYANGSSGGEASHTLTVNEMPTHSHGASTNTTGGHSHNTSCSATGAHSHKYNTIIPNAAVAPSASGVSAGDWSEGINTDTCDNHSHTIGIGEAGAHSHSVTIYNTGGNAAHNNMPPYVAYYCWERTA